MLIDGYNQQFTCHDIILVLRKENTAYAEQEEQIAIQS